MRKVFDLRPAAIIQNFDLCRPIYRQISNYGHMGREDLNLPWEQRGPGRSAQGGAQRLNSTILMVRF